jgi:hypothetical protein
MRARVFLPALALFAAVLVTRAVRAESPISTDVAQELDSLPPEIANSVRVSLDRLEAQRVSSEPLMQKLREGRAKNIPPQQLAQVLGRMTDDLLWLDAQLAPCACAKAADAKARLMSLGTDTLLGALSRDDFGAALTVVCASVDGVGRLASALELFAYATNRLRVSKSVAWSFTTTLLKRNESKSSENQLVLVLQEIFKARGTVESALTLATTRLAAGSTLRATANELRDQFLGR